MHIFMFENAICFFHSRSRCTRSQRSEVVDAKCLKIRSRSVVQAGGEFEQWSSAEGLGEQQVRWEVGPTEGTR